MKKAWIALLFLSLVVWFFHKEIRTALFSGFVMADILWPGKSPLLRYLSSQPSMEVVQYLGGGREMEADLYFPKDRRPHSGIILIHGVNQVGKSDSRVKWAAEIFCRAGFVVLAPDFLGFKSLRLRPTDVREIEDSFLYLESRKDLVRPDRLGIAGFSYGAGPTLIAACNPRIRKKVDFVISFGGYYDLKDIIQFVTTGYYSYRGKSYYQAPNDYDRWIFLRYNLDLLSDEEDRRILQKVEVWKERGAKAGVLDKLSSAGQSVYRLLRNRDPAKMEAVLSGLPPRVLRYIEVLSPCKHIQDLRAYLFVVHGTPDPFIPHTESLRLYDALPDRNKAHLALLRIFTHVRPSLPRPTCSNILFVYLPEGIKFYSLVYDLIQKAA